MTTNVSKIKEFVVEGVLPDPPPFTNVVVDYVRPIKAIVPGYWIPSR